MNKDRLSLVSGFMPSAAMIILLAFEYAVKNNYAESSPAVIGLTVAAAFLLPFAVILALMHGEEEAVYRFRGFKMRYFSFILLMSAAMSFMSFLLNWLVSYIFTSGYSAQDMTFMGGWNTWEVLLVSVFLPALSEELFFRGGLFSAQEGSGTVAAMVISAFTFALIHGDPSNIIGPLAVGLAYAYMTYITGSVWSAVFAHVINNAMTLGIGYLLQRYSAVGLWRYFVIIVFVLFLVCLYFAMGKLEKLTEKGRVPRMKTAGISKGVSSVVFTPGIWLLIVIYAFKIFYLGA